MIWLIAWAALLLFAAPAHSHIPDLDRYQRIAERYYPINCAPEIRQVREINDNVLAWFRPELCVIEFPATASPYRDHIHYWPRWQLCATVVHEYGHAAGLEHSTNPNHVMWKKSSWQATPRVCRREGHDAANSRRKR